MEERHFLLFASLVAINPHFNQRSYLCCTAIALPVESSFGAVRTWVSVVASPSVLDDLVTVNKLLAELIGAQML